MRVDMDMELGSVWTPACDTEPHPSGVCATIVGGHPTCTACRARWDDAEHWAPPAACATPSACSAPGAEFCDACWGAWEADEYEHTAVSRSHGLEAAIVYGTWRAKAHAVAAETRRRKGGRAKVERRLQPVASLESQARWWQKKIKQATYDAKRRPPRTTPAERAEQCVQRAAEHARVDADRAARGVRPKRRYGEGPAQYLERLRAFAAQRTLAVATPDQCTGETTNGARCRLRGSMRHPQAAPLRAGGSFCAHHEPDAALSGVTRCAGTCPDEARCKFTSACSFPAARPLREGSAYCSRHLWQGWAPPAECTGEAGACAAQCWAQA